MEGARPGLSTCVMPANPALEAWVYTVMSIVMTSNGPALIVGGRLLKLAQRDGEAVLLVDKWHRPEAVGALYLSDAVELVSMFRKILDALHIEVSEDGEGRASFPVAPDIQSFLDAWEARFEDLEEDRCPEDDCRDLPMPAPALAA